ncbi:hypothetical protein [Methanobacterium spitsbergense]|uniref:Uncharacterized protein n=1 Tax=Methanobacterium spitsbergense TaxID=2874285 RepID=A0A8T5USQ1_9EURY|nr:hypothetical protein [Methanobacterium spitsbergense]MBZ2166724.1 hypothetical protein [Methanobacterium spitsbergense]
MNSPAVTAGGGEIVKKNRAWSAGAVMNMNTASITAKTPASLGLRSHIETSPASGSNRPTVMKNPAKASVRSSGIRGSTPNGVKRKPKMKPKANKTANTRSELVKDTRVRCCSFPSCLFGGWDFVD